MMGEWKALKKRQKKERRALKRQRREAKRALKRERREARRAGKRERKEARREARRGPGSPWVDPVRAGGSFPVRAGVSSPNAVWPGRGGFLNRFGEAGYASVDRAGPGYPTSHSEGVDYNPALETHQNEVALLEKQIAEKERRLVEVHEEIVREQEEGVKGRRSVSAEGKSMSPAVKKALELEKEIDAAVRKLEIVRTQNDERLARELARLDDRLARDLGGLEIKEAR